MRPEALQWSSENCTIGRAMEILGERWTVVVLREVFVGVRRFDDFVEMLGIPRNVLTERLSRLVDEGLLRKVAYQEAPVRYEYRLTEKGLGLYPVIVTLLEWGNDFFEWPDGEPPVHLVDRTTGERIDPVLVDGRTGEPLDPRRTKAIYVRDPKAGRAAVPSR